MHSQLALTESDQSAMTYDELVQRTVGRLSESLEDRKQGFQRRTRAAQLAKRARFIANCGKVPINFPMDESGTSIPTTDRTIRKTSEISGNATS